MSSPARGRRAPGRCRWPRGSRRCRARTAARRPDCGRSSGSYPRRRSSLPRSPTRSRWAAAGRVRRRWRAASCVAIGPCSGRTETSAVCAACGLPSAFLTRMQHGATVRRIQDYPLYSQATHSNSPRASLSCGYGRYARTTPGLGSGEGLPGRPRARHVPGRPRGTGRAALRGDGTPARRSPPGTRSTAFAPPSRGRSARRPRTGRRNPRDGGPRGRPDRHRHAAHPGRRPGGSCPPRSARGSTHRRAGGAAGRRRLRHAHRAGGRLAAGREQALPLRRPDGDPRPQKDGTRIMRVTLTLTNRTGAPQATRAWRLAATADGVPAELVEWPAAKFRGVPTRRSTRAGRSGSSWRSGCRSTPCRCASPPSATPRPVPCSQAPCSQRRTR